MTTVDDVGTMTAQWTDPAGVVWPLTNIDPTVGYFTRPGITGWGATAYTLTTDPVARSGVRVRTVRGNEARLTWPLHVYGDDHQGFVTAYRALKRAFMMTVHLGAPGTLRVTRPDGTAREIEAYYEDGFAGNGGSEDWMSANPVLTLMCPDGYWRDITSVSETRSYATGNNFLNPFFTLSSGSVLGASTINNPGDVEAWPDWTVTGPATVITASNDTTGESFVLTKTLTAGQLITISTADATVRGPVGENLVNGLNWPDATLWSLLSGANTVTFSVAGATAGTSITLVYYPRYEGA